MVSMRKSRLSRYRQDRLIEHFVAGTTARTAASLCGVNRKTAAFYFHRLCEIIQLELDAENEAMFGGEIEVDESYFGGKRKGKRVKATGDKSRRCLFWHRQQFVSRLVEECRGFSHTRKRMAETSIGCGCRRPLRTSKYSHATSARYAWK